MGWFENEVGSHSKENITSSLISSWTSLDFFHDKFWVYPVVEQTLISINNVYNIIVYIIYYVLYIIYYMIYIIYIYISYIRVNDSDTGLLCLVFRNSSNN